MNLVEIKARLVRLRHQYGMLDEALQRRARQPTDRLKMVASLSAPVLMDMLEPADCVSIDTTILLAVKRYQDASEREVARLEGELRGHGSGPTA